jgi:hypothetical protein
MKRMAGCITTGCNGRSATRPAAEPERYAARVPDGPAIGANCENGRSSRTWRFVPVVPWIGRYRYTAASGTQFGTEIAGHQMDARYRYTAASGLVWVVEGDRWQLRRRGRLLRALIQRPEEQK